MLVKRSIVEKWYQRDSWVYKNFAFLFQNPLWTKSVPRGFTVCPYFWMSLFSFIIFRPLFVAPIQFLLLPIIRLGGKPVMALDKWLLKTLQRFNWAPEGVGSGGGLGFTLLFLLAVTMVVAAAGLLVVGVIKFYPYITISRLGTFSFWSIATVISLGGIIALHKKVTDTECKTIYYLFAWLVLDFIGMFIFIPNELGAGTKSVLSVIGMLCREIGSVIWLILQFLGHWLYVIFGWKPIAELYVPWWGYVIAFTILAWLSTSLLTKFEYKAPVFNPNETEEERKKRNRNAWSSLLLRTLMANKFWGTGQVMSDYDGDVYDALDSHSEILAAKEYCMAIYQKAIEIFFGEDLNKLQQTYPDITPDAWEAIRGIENTEVRFERLQLVWSGIRLNNTFTNCRFQVAVVDAIKTPEINAAIKELAALYDAEEARKEKRRLAKKNSWSHQMCLKVTGTLSVGFNRFGRGFKWIAVQLWTLLAYLWMLVKAKKQGACPYFQFTDTEIKK